MIRRFSSVAAVVLVILSTQLAPAAAEDEIESRPLEVIAKVAQGSGESTDLEAMTLAMDAVSVEPLLESRGIYRVTSDHIVTFKDDGTAKLDGDAKKWLKESVEKHPSVIWAEADTRRSVDDGRFHAWPQSLPEAAMFSDLVGQAAFADLDLAQAHTMGTGSGVVVAVLDTGVDPDHPFLAGRLVSGYDLVDDDNDPTDEVNGIDDDADGVIDEAFGHGTFIAGIVAQVAPGALVLPIRVLDADGQGELYAIIEAIDVAVEAGADVINMSFGILAKNDSKAFDAALKRAHKAGVVVVAAAGNSGGSEEYFPAAAKDVISVSALGPNNELLAPFSNHGKWVHIAAPGVDVVSAIPGGGYATWSGTSMATPIVSSLAAVLWDFAPDESGKDVSKAILDGARKMDMKERAEKGIIDFLRSLEKIS